MKNVICGLLIVVGIFGTLMWCVSGVNETEQQYGGKYDECVKSHEPSVCKRVFLD